MPQQQTAYGALKNYVSDKANMAALYAVQAALGSAKRSKKKKKDEKKKSPPKQPEKKPFGYEGLAGLKRSRSRVEEAARMSRGG